MPSSTPAQFVENLATYTPEGTGLAGPWFNPWRETCEVMDLVPDAPLGRRARLTAHLSSPEIRVLLCGEAPGYQGARVSGIPFTSERLLLEQAIPGMPALTSRLTRRNRPYSEPSATIMWGILSDLGLERQVALTNAFPFHPHHPGEPFTNRTPNAAELAFGAKILTQLLEVLPKGIRLIPVGGKAAGTLRKLGFEIPEGVALRHPSMGGATEFRKGMTALFGKDERPAGGRTVGDAQPWIV